MILPSAKGSNKFGIVKTVFVNTNIALERPMIFMKNFNSLYKTTGYSQNIYQLLYSPPFLSVKATKTYIHGVRLV